MYEQGFKVPSPCFLAFCRQNPSSSGGPKVGFTASRALGKSVLRNRMKRRLRETVRRRLSELSPCWEIVLNVRRGTLSASPEFLASEVERLFQRCKP